MSGWIEERGRFRDGEWGEVGKELMEGMGVGIDDEGGEVVDGVVGEGELGGG